MTKSDLLEKLGMKSRTPAIMRFPWPMAGIFAAGVVVGAVMALLLAPRSGAELRGAIGRRAARLRPKSVGERRGDNGGLEHLEHDELLEKAQGLDIENYDEMSRTELIEAIEAK